MTRVSSLALLMDHSGVRSSPSYPISTAPHREQADGALLLSPRPGLGAKSAQGCASSPCIAITREFNPLRATKSRLLPTGSRRMFRFCYSLAPGSGQNRRKAALARLACGSLGSSILSELPNLDCSPQGAGGWCARTPRTPHLSRSAFAIPSPRARGKIGARLR